MIVAVLFPDRMSDDKNEILQKHEARLSTVQEYISEKLDPRKINLSKSKKSRLLRSSFNN